MNLKYKNYFMVHCILTVLLPLQHGVVLIFLTKNRHKRNGAEKKGLLPNGFNFHELINSHLENKKDSTLRIVVGLDMYHTDPSVLENLYYLKEVYTNRVNFYLSDSAAGTTFHPKTYVFHYGKGRKKALIGSANATLGGIRNNYETSTLVECEANNKSDLFFKSIDADIDNLVKTRQIVPATEELIASYKWKYLIYHEFRKASNTRASRLISEREKYEKLLKHPLTKTSINSTAPSYDRFELLRIVYETMKAEQNGFRNLNNQVQIRNVRYSSALQRLKEIAKLPKKIDWTSKSDKEKSKDFLGIYEDLVDNPNHFWTSSELSRHKTTIANNKDGLEKLINAIADFDSMFSSTEDLESLYNRIWIPITEIGYAGINLLSEILHTYDKSKFAIMNGNSISGHTLANFGRNWEQDKKKINFSQYSRFCEDSLQIQKELGLKDLSEVDAVLNYSYYNPSVSEI